MDFPLSFLVCRNVVRKKKQFSHLPRRIFRPELTTCLSCGTRLKRYATLSRRIVITLKGALEVIHCGYRCPNRHCQTSARSYRSTEADALALPGFTFGLDIVILVGQLRLANHLTLDEVHQALQQDLMTQNVTISRREIMYLFEAYCSLLRAAQQPSEDPEFQAWRAKVEANGGLIISIDGIQPDKGNETLYLVRDVLTGRLLVAENVASSETAMMKRVLSPVLNLGVPVLGVISDAQHSERLAVAQLWPEVPHQTCHFHSLREASQPIYHVDRSTRTAMRKTIGNRLKKTRNQMAHQLRTEQKPADLLRHGEQKQSQVLADYALGIVTALNLEGNQPFEYAGITAFEALEEVEGSLLQLEKKGDQ
jgi:hypothetical protein